MVNSKIRLIILSAAKDGESLYSQQKQPGADCGSDNELLVAKFRIKWKKTIILFRYNLSLITYDYTVKVMNRFKGLDLVERVPEELWTEIHNIVQKAVTKTIPKKKKCKKAHWLSEKFYK